MSDFDELDSLVGPAVARARQDIKAAREKASRKSIDGAAAEKISAQKLFLDPENWMRTRGVALIHEETQTLLGNFSEYVHKSVAGARRLVREESPISVSATERVDGSWWLGEDRKPEPPRPWHEKRVGFIHMHLSKLGVHSPACEVLAHLSYGSLARVELALDTVFAQEDTKSEQLLTLPAGTNVLEVMSSDCKVGLLQDLGRGDA